MNNKVVELMFALIRSAINGTKLANEQLKLYSEDVLPDLYTLCEKHDIAHLVGVGLQTNSLILPTSEYYSKFYIEISSAIVNYQKQKHEFEKLCKFFNDSKIPFIPLKGSVIRDLYLEPWMRTSSDIDILIHESDLEESVEKYSKISPFSEPCTKDGHHISVTTTNGVHVEFHYDLVESDYANNASSLLTDIWNFSYPINENEFRYEVNTDMFMLYHFAHMSKHFEVGGCGIRPLMDTYLIGRTLPISDIANSELFEKSNLKKFAQLIIELSNVWFGDKEHTDSTKRLESFILDGGVFGTLKNQLFLKQHKAGGKLKYAKSRIFMPYDSLKMLYPVLEKHKWLLPIMQVRRWFRIVFRGRLKRSVNVLKHSTSITDEQSESIRQMLSDLGL